MHLKAKSIFREINVTEQDRLRRAPVAFQYSSNENDRRRSVVGTRVRRVALEGHADLRKPGKVKKKTASDSSRLERSGSRKKSFGRRKKDSFPFVYLDRPDR